MCTDCAITVVAGSSKDLAEWNSDSTGFEWVEYRLLHECVANDSAVSTRSFDGALLIEQLEVWR